MGIYGPSIMGIIIHIIETDKNWSVKFRKRLNSTEMFVKVTICHWFDFNTSLESIETSSLKHCSWIGQPNKILLTQLFGQS